MRVICFCGTQIDVDDELAICPKCGEITSTMTTLPHIKVQMEKEMKLFFELWERDLIE